MCYQQQKAAVIKISVLTYYIAPDLSRSQKSGIFFFRCCVAFSPRKEELYIGPMLKARVGQIGTSKDKLIHGEGAFCRFKNEVLE